MFRQSDIPKRLIPGTIALGAFTFTMDALPGTPQIQNIIPTTFFKTTTYAAAWLGLIGAIFVLITGLAYLEWRRRQAAAKGEGYGTGHSNEPEPVSEENLANPVVAILPLILVGVLNKVFTGLIPTLFGSALQSVPGHPMTVQVTRLAAIWAVEEGVAGRHPLGARVRIQDGDGELRRGHQAAVAGSLLAAMNTASEYGFGGVIASLPGFLVVADALSAIPNPWSTRP
jgi:H+/gluconate symporter-like permease